MNHVLRYLSIDDLTLSCVCHLRASLQPLLILFDPFNHLD